MPFVELKQPLVVCKPLNLENLANLPNARASNIHSKQVVEPWVISLATLLRHSSVRDHQDHKIVGNRPPIQVTFDSGHQPEFNALKSLRIVLESEGLMLVVNKSLPKPG